MSAGRDAAEPLAHVSTSVAAVVPAAGLSSRFGSMKLVAPVDGEPLLDRTLASVLDAGIAPVVVVVSSEARLESVRRLAEARVRVVVNPEPARGMFSSIQIGLVEALGSSAVVVLPADMPFVASTTIRTVAAECLRLNQPIVATHGGRRGHPIALPGTVVPLLLSAASTGSLKEALASTGHAGTHLEVHDPGVVRDVDVPSDLFT